MVINITGGKEYQRKRVRSVIEYCQKMLMPKMNELEINVKIRKFSPDEDAYGYCLALDGPRPDRPREFELEIHSGMKLRTMLETVCHEMVHVKQYARGELYESERQSKHRWQGKWIDRDPDYWDRPWEIEAHGREIGLFVRWAQENKLGKRKWTHE
jgi:hypothetical protein